MTSRSPSTAASLVSYSCSALISSS
jgi:hypothetical protein